MSYATTNLSVGESMSIVQMTPTSVGITMNFMRRQAPELARDIVCQLDRAANLAASYNLTPTQWEVLRVWPAFRQMVQEANEELGGSAGTLERARRRAALAVAEVVVQDMATISGDPKVAARDRINAAQLLADIGAVTAKQQAVVAGAGGVGFGGALIQIVMPNGSHMQIGEAEPEPKLAVIEGQATRIENDQ